MSDETDAADRREPLDNITRDIEDELRRDQPDPHYRFMLLQLGRLASHFRSEQGTLIRALERIAEHQVILRGDKMKGIEGMDNKVDKLLHEATEGKWVRRAILAAIVGHLIVQMLK